MKYALTFGLLFICCLRATAQDTSVTVDKQVYILPGVVVHNNLDYASILRRIKNDTTFYKAFKTLRVIQYSAYNYINIPDKKGASIATYSSKSIQHRANGCRTTEITDVHTTGDFFDRKGNYNYTTGEMYAGLFFSKGQVCGETNTVAGSVISTEGKSGIDKHKEQLKMLFFNPGKKIPGIPFIGNKLDLYDDNAHKLYDYKLDFVAYKGGYAYVFSIKPKPDLGFFRRNDIVVDEMTTWFDSKTMEVLARTYKLSYNAFAYNFDVDMQVEMTHTPDGQLVPQLLRYKGDFGILFKKHERGEFTATLFDFKK
ncbi:MAG TPA: hypothetical protein VG738_00765 [Chitinophagaceae bacterium]|nr:hypothetical protein [Chitinophagaceae bacterium]